MPAPHRLFGFQDGRMGRLPLMGTAGFQSWTVEIQMHGRSFFRPLMLPHDGFQGQTNCRNSQILR